MLSFENNQTLFILSNRYIEYIWLHTPYIRIDITNSHIPFAATLVQRPWTCYRIVFFFLCKCFRVFLNVCSPEANSTGDHHTYGLCFHLLLLTSNLTDMRVVLRIGALEIHLGRRCLKTVRTVILVPGGCCLLFGRRRSSGDGR